MLFGMQAKYGLLQKRGDWQCSIGHAYLQLSIYLLLQFYFCTFLLTCIYFSVWIGSTNLAVSHLPAKLYVPSTLNIDHILWHTQLIICAENVKSWFKSWVFPFTFQAYILPHTLNCMCVSLFKFHI